MKKNKNVVVAARGLRAGGKYTEESARNVIKRAGGSIGQNTVSHPSPGIKVLGAMDALINYCGYWRKEND